MTGVTTFFIDDKIDTGNIILREEVQIYPFENAGDLHDRLKKYGARLVIRTLDEISENKINPVSQTHFMLPEESLKPAPKIHPNDCNINWDNDSVKIHNFIRGLAPDLCARSFFKNDIVKYGFKIYESQPEIEKHFFKPGQIISDGKHFIKIACRDGFINIASLKLEGKKRMNTVEFLRGFRINDFAVHANSPA
jgi:methionyl-tRNA formyltransferase